MLVTAIGRIRSDFPAAEFNVFSYYPEKDSHLASDPRVHVLDGTPFALVFRHFLGALILKVLGLVGITIKSPRVLNIARALKSSDLLLDIGGITFADGREKFLPFNILTIWPAMILGTPVVKLAQAVGPFEHTINRTLARLFLSRCEHIFLRGESSARFITRLNLPPGKTSPAADIAFLYQPDYALSNENASRVSDMLATIQQEKDKGKKVILIAPSILVDRKLSKRNVDYGNLLISALAQLDSDHCFFIFLPNATREGSLKHHNNDILIIDQIHQRLRDSAHAGSLHKATGFIDYDINTHGIREIVCHADLLITSRYHAMISGLALSIPTIVIGWGHKYRETMAAFGQSKYVLNTTESDFNLAGLIANALNQSAQIRKDLQNHLPDIQRLAESQFITIRQFIK